MHAQEMWLSRDEFHSDGTFPDDAVKWGGYHSPASIAVAQLWFRAVKHQYGPWQGCSVQDLEQAVEWWNARVDRIMRD